MAKKNDMKDAKKAAKVAKKTASTAKKGKDHRGCGSKPQRKLTKKNAPLAVSLDQHIAKAALGVLSPDTKRKDRHNDTKQRVQLTRADTAASRLIPAVNAPTKGKQ